MPWVYIWTSPLKCAYVWTTAVKCIYVWTTKVRPTDKFVDYLLIWGGGGWGRAYNQTSTHFAWGGGAWGAILCEGYCLNKWNYCVVIWAWGAVSTTCWCNGWSSCFWTVVAYGWGWGWGCCWTKACGRDGWSWGWAAWGGTYCACVGKGCAWQGCDGGRWVCTTCYKSWGWGWGSRWVWGNATSDGCCWGNGGLWICTDISWAYQCFAWGWGGGGRLNAWGKGCYWGWNGWYYGAVKWCAATTCWSGGWGGSCATCGGAWACWVFIIRYKCWEYTMTWGNCKYACNIGWTCYCIHCFTSNGTLTVS